MQNRWLLPEAVDELLPPAAEQLEQLRRTILDCYRSWGYQLVMPPVVEFLDALLTGVGSELDTQTFKLTDQASGKLMGVRADMTPQAARIDAHQLKHNPINRLCYFGTVLRTKAGDVGGSRNPLQVGVELFGSNSLAADIEVAALLLESLSMLDVEQPILDIGHVDVLTELMQIAELSSTQRDAIFQLLQRKAIPEIKAFGQQQGLNQQHAQWFCDLAELNGSADEFAEAQEKLSSAGATVTAALADMQELMQTLQTRYPNVQMHYDLAELNGYQYQTGIVFAAFVPGVSRAVARGGRYDGIGQAFERDGEASARPATGFSLDIKSLLVGNADDNESAAEPWLATADTDPAKIAELRAAGDVVIYALPDQQQNGKTIK